ERSIAARRAAFRPVVESLETRLLLQATLTGLSPNTAPEGSPALTLTVNGSGFTSDAVVEWNGSNLATTFQSDSQLTAVVPANFLNEESTPAHGGNPAVTVLQAGASSNGLPFSISEVPVAAVGYTINGVEDVLIQNAPVATF